jgi:hypothetical protein
VLAICQSEANPERPPKASARKEDIHSSSPMAGPRPRRSFQSHIISKTTIPSKEDISEHLKIICVWVYRCTGVRVYGCEGIRVYGCLGVCVPEIYFRCTKIICFNR